VISGRFVGFIYSSLIASVQSFDFILIKSDFE
jgi:hypothetical protein